MGASLLSMKMDFNHMQPFSVKKWWKMYIYFYISHENSAWQWWSLSCKQVSPFLECLTLFRTDTWTMEKLTLNSRMWIMFLKSIKRYGMDTLSALLALCEGNPLLTGGFHSQGNAAFCLFPSMLIPWKICWTSSSIAGDLRRPCDVWNVVSSMEMILPYTTQIFRTGYSFRSIILK